jgi:hypothetical protein
MCEIASGIVGTQRHGTFGVRGMRLIWHAPNTTFSVRVMR